MFPHTFQHKDYVEHVWYCKQSNYQSVCNYMQSMYVSVLLNRKQNQTYWLVNQYQIVQKKCVSMIVLWGQGLVLSTRCLTFWLCHLRLCWPAFSWFSKRSVSRPDLRTSIRSLLWPASTMRRMWTNAWVCWASDCRCKSPTKTIVSIRTHNGIVVMTYLPHFLDCWIWLHLIKVGQLIIFVHPVDVTSTRNLPENQPKGIHISPFERIEVVGVYRFIEHLYTKIRKKYTSKHYTALTQIEIFTSGAIYRLVPTRCVDGMSTASFLTSWRTARPRSPIAQLKFDLTKIFFDFRSRWAIAGLPVEIIYI